jgi:hypothetical protein
MKLKLTYSAAGAKAMVLVTDNTEEILVVAVP